MALSKKAFASLLASVTAAIGATGQGFAYFDAAQVAPLVEAGKVETNESMKNEQGHVAVRMVEAAAETGTDTDTGAPAEAPKAKPAFAIDDNIEIPAGSARAFGSGGNTIYPFDDLNVNQSFFVPATEDKPNPAKSLASTVSSANARYAEVVEGQTRVNRKGKEVPVTRETRKFVVRAVDETAQGRGKGARIWRTA